MPLNAVQLEVPAEPTKIVAVGRNYRAHAAELGNAVPSEPLLFLKPPSSLLRPGGGIALPPESGRVEFEGELALVVGRRCRRIAPAQVAECLAGLTCFVDVTARDLQRQDVQFTRGKGFDTFAPCGPWLVSGLDPGDLRLETRVNGEVRQDGRTSEMVHSPLNLVSYISGIMTLEPGDLIVTGTPAGVGPLKSGDSVTVTIEGIGSLENTVL
jgi:2-keto-4-pentenoate hydratase/2-oxohepta-3-ene-1,7-dioic acid hydratase in catechol pathway